jgi:hypothetical protein
VTHAEEDDTMQNGDSLNLEKYGKAQKKSSDAILLQLSHCPCSYNKLRYPGKGAHDQLCM